MKLAQGFGKRKETRSDARGESPKGQELGLKKRKIEKKIDGRKRGLSTRRSALLL